MKEKTVKYTWNEVISSFRTNLGRRLLTLLLEDWYSIRELSNITKEDYGRKIQTNPHVRRLVRMWSEVGILEEKNVTKYFKRTRNGKEHVYPSKKPRFHLNLAKFFSLYFRFFLRFSVPMNKFSDDELFAELKRKGKMWRIFFPIKEETPIDNWFNVLFEDDDVREYIFSKEIESSLTYATPLKMLEKINPMLSDLERIVLKFFKQLYIVHDQFNRPELDLLPEWVKKIEEKYVDKSLEVTTLQEIKKLWEQYYTELFENYIKREWKKIKSKAKKGVFGNKEILHEEKKKWEEECKKTELPAIKLFAWMRLLPLGNELYDVFSGDIEDILGLDAFSFVAASLFK